MFKDWPLLIAIALAFIATFSIFQYMKTQQEQMRRELVRQVEKEKQDLKREYESKLAATRRYSGKTLRVVVAKKDISAGDLITSEVVELKNVPSSLKAPMSAGSLDAVIGKLASSNIVAGEQIMLNRIISPKAQQSSIVPPGTRLVTVQVEQLDLFKFLRPGDHVDIALMFQLPQSNVVTSGLFQDVTVKAINGRISYSIPTHKSHPDQKAIQKRVSVEEKPKSISVNPNKGTLSFALPQKDAAVLFMASKLGKIEIYPRSSFDPDKTKLPPITADSVLQLAMPKLTRQLQSKAAGASSKEAEKQNMKEIKDMKEIKEEKVEKVPAGKIEENIRKVKVRKGGVITWVNVGDSEELTGENTEKNAKKAFSGDDTKVKEGNKGSLPDKNSQGIKAQKKQSGISIEPEGVVNEV